MDDDRASARRLGAHLERPGRVAVEFADRGADALARLARGGVDAMLTELWLPEMDGAEMMRRVRGVDAALPVIVLSGQATLELAVDAMRAGAADFLQKPVNVTALMARVERAVGERPPREDPRAAAGNGRARQPSRLVGSHPRLEEVRALAEQIARAPYARVLVTGETGTGKTMVARTLHDLSGAAGRFAHVNCAALPGPLLEAELFGYEKGAFTDARELKRGLIESADGGTVFLDEVDSLPLELQAKLLLVLEAREVRRVGGVEPVRVRTRVVAATGADLRARADAGAFRRDLLYRLDVAAIRMPPLREMPEVVPELALAFVREICSELERPLPEVSPASLRALSAHPWPGNARELRNAVERALIFHRGGTLEVAVPEGPAPGPGVSGPVVVGLELGLTLEEVEARYLRAVIAAGDGGQAGMAAALGISRKTLWDKRRRYGL